MSTEFESGRRELPVLPLRDLLVLPGMSTSLFVGRPGSLAAVEDAERAGQDLVLIGQRDPGVDQPVAGDLLDHGTLATLIRRTRTDGATRIDVRGRVGARVHAVQVQDQQLRAVVSEVPEEEDSAVLRGALLRQLQPALARYLELKADAPAELAALSKSEDVSGIGQELLRGFRMTVEQKRDLVAARSPCGRLEVMLGAMLGELEVLEVEQSVQQRVQRNMDRSQRRYFLNEQMQAIQEELGEHDEFAGELVEIEQRIHATALSEEALRKCRRELKRLRLTSPMNPESAVVRNYLDWMLTVPWSVVTPECSDLAHAERILDQDHSGLRDIKERILEHLAVQQLVAEPRGPILCFVGPPGVGKTSLARSIARATDRNFVRMSLGGVRDEAEIRGHRRTYIGAMPGKILQGMKKAESSNPVMLLDEIDKLSVDFRGDPASALLEVLDPEQNHLFNDHYLDVDYDLSKVMFLCTANHVSGIPVALRDRLEIIRLPGYTDEEKITIARDHLVGKQLVAHGLDGGKVKFHPSAIRCILDEHTREAGVRQLERAIARCCRKIARRVASRGPRAVHVTPRLVHAYLGVPRFRRQRCETSSLVGVATGLAWTQVGGVLLSTEIAVMPGKGKLIATGTLGKVMQESAQAAMSYLRTRASSLGLAEGFNLSLDVHVHVPEGATPKDGPSAGVTIATAMISALTRIPVRADVALTGEVTLRGRVMAVGGVKEKVLAAHRAGITAVVLPRESEKDLEDLPRSVRASMRFIPVEHMDEVLRHALDLADPERFAAQLQAGENTAPPPRQLPDVLTTVAN